MMKRREFLKTAGLSLLSLVSSGCAAAPAGYPRKTAGRKPNFVFILIDDLGWRDLGFMGSTYYETPHIDELATEGVVFTSAYTNAPNCAPTRACLMSGQYGPRHGIYTVGTSERGPANMRKLIPVKNTRSLPTSSITIAEALKAGGYTSACIGKWHLGRAKPYRPQDRGFDFVFDRTGGGHFTRDSQYLTDVLTDKALEFIESNKNRPFFLYLAHHAVHTPIQAKPELIRKYEKKKGDAIHNNPTYAAMIESVDESVGRILNKLKCLGLAEETVVFFFSDNGGYGNVTAMTPLRGSKGMLYEGGIRVPLIVRWPGRAKPGRCEVPVIGIDFFPTMLEMASLPRPRGHILDGESIVPLLKGRDKLKRTAIYWHFPAYLEPYNEKQRPWRTTPAGAVRKGDWKLIEFFEDGKLELYNLKEDIGESNDLACALPKKTRELHNMLLAWRKRLNAPVPTEKNPRYDPNAATTIRPGKRKKA